ncbi:MAG: hypothetical protein OXE92_05365 [Bacteroidetes bacterium]|nr:hypothetical protein [Bacteroidota bacterium]MCY4205138.1 hypothetical protein [Bacteroidota bacterium]
MIKILATILFLIGCIQPVNAQQFDQLTRPVATLSDSTEIWVMLDALLIPAIGRVDRADIVDVTSNGFGPNDLVILYPSMETYEIGDDVPQLLQESMKSWEITADYRLDATRQEGKRITADAHLSQDARAALTADVLSAVSRYYDGDEFELRMSQDAQGVRLEIWNYDPDAMHYRVPIRPVSRDTLWQSFRFASPEIVMAFKDASDCIETYTDQGRVHTRPCE